MKGDFTLDKNFEFKFANGDFITSEETLQDVNLIIQSNVGQIRPLPIYGVGIENYLNSNDVRGAKRKIIQSSKNISVAINNINIEFSRDSEWSVDISIKKVNTTNA